MHEKLHIIITLFAAAMVALFSYIFFESLNRAVINLIVTIIVFFILGSVFKNIIDKGLEEAKIKEEEAENEISNDEIEAMEDIEDIEDQEEISL